jgi:hypothetical protein
LHVVDELELKSPGGRKRGRENNHYRKNLFHRAWGNFDELLLHYCGKNKPLAPPRPGWRAGYVISGKKTLAHPVRIIDKVCQPREKFAMMRLPACLMAALTFSPLAMAQDAEKKPPLTVAIALKLGVEGLTSYTNPSEAGQDQAARLYAAARRLKTENALAQEDLAQVPVLDSYRDVLSKCRVGSCELAYIVNGGGTMYHHGEARDCASVEDFLVDVAKQLPFGEGKGSAKATAKIDAAIAFLKTLKTYDSGEADANKEAAANLDAERDRVIEHWQDLKYYIAEIPAREADRIAAFAEDSLGWLKPQEQ